MHDERKRHILSSIIEHFIQTAQPVGSKTIILTYNLQVSPATVRNDMAALERQGLITQPHTSAGRVPTDKGYRLYVDELADYDVASALARETIQSIRDEQKVQEAKQQVFAAVSLLNQASPNVAFGTIPENDRTFFMGFSKMLRQPEFMDAPLQASQVMEVIEDRQNFLRGLKSLPIERQAKILIGDENILHGIDSCSLIVTTYEIQGYTGYMGILGPKRMPYAFNTAALNQVRSLLEDGEL